VELSALRYKEQEVASGSEFIVRAAFYEKKGPAREVLQLGEVPVPEPGEGEVRIRIVASAVNPTDTKARAGWLGRVQMPYARVIPHQDGAGTIDKVGSGVAATRVGERVWVYEAQWQRPFGTAAECTVVPSAQAVTLPEGVGFDEGACLGIPAMTAHRCVFADGAVCGQTVFVAGGIGAVGSYAVQLAKWGGARVIASVSSANDAARVTAAGADHVIDREIEDVSRQVMDITDGKGVDRIVEVAFGANAYLDAAIIRDGGIVAAYASDADHDPRIPFYGYMTKNVTLHLVLVYKMSAAAHRQAAVEITRCLEARGLRHTISRRFSLADLAQAHEAMEAGGVGGKIIVTI
jgi:NADPH2:quinone reductase